VTKWRDQAKFNHFASKPIERKTKSVDTKNYNNNIKLILKIKLDGLTNFYALEAKRHLHKKTGVG
jgi:hypothetical protein